MVVGLKSFLVVLCRNGTQLDKYSAITQICRYKSKVYDHPKWNQSEGLIFLSEFDVDDLHLLTEEMKKSYDIQKIEESSVIKTTTAFLPTFNDGQIRYSICNVTDKYVTVSTCPENFDTMVRPVDPR